MTGLEASPRRDEARRRALRDLSRRDAFCTALGAGGGSGAVGETAPLGTASFNAVLIACVEGRDYATALDLMETMRERGVLMNALTYTAAITAAQKAGDVGAAVKWLDEMSARRELPQSDLTLTPTVSAHSRTWRSEEALTLLAKFGRRGGVALPPRTAAYNEAIAACVREERWEEALRLYRHMDAGSAAAPCDQTTLSLAARAAAELADWRTGCDLLAESRRLGWQPSVIAIASVMRACGERGEWRPAMQLLHDASIAAPHVAAAAAEAEAGARRAARPRALSRPPPRLCLAPARPPSPRAPRPAATTPRFARSLTRRWGRR